MKLLLAHITYDSINTDILTRRCKTHIVGRCGKGRSPLAFSLASTAVIAARLTQILTVALVREAKATKYLVKSSRQPNTCTEKRHGDVGASNWMSAMSNQARIGPSAFDHLSWLSWSLDMSLYLDKVFASRALWWQNKPLCHPCASTREARRPQICGCDGARIKSFASIVPGPRGFLRKHRKCQINSASKF